MEKLIVGLGEILWDMLPEGKQLGGAPSNFAFHTTQFGFKSKVVSAIGDDLLGQEIVDLLKQRNIDSYLSKNNHSTGTVQVQLDSNGVPTYQITEEVAWDYIPFTEELKEIAKQTICVCFGTLAQRNEMSRNTILKFLQNMPKGNTILKILDINLRQNFYTWPTIEQSLYACNTLKINDEELILLSKKLGLTHKNIQGQCQFILQLYSLKMVILTCGVKGSYVFTPEKESFKPTTPIEVVDTVGAGDSFTAAFCATLLKGKSIEEAHQRAVDVSAYICSCAGAMPMLKEEHIL
ncbi:carbohydrate kinase family protein [Bacteroides coprosuis]|uniref:carbohydrate kinase family protein n=1 Tax=Bacteroides coprosuis TaxID=151276 RepID=UPI001D576C74|nr:carbohydrate kinase [Bacteroides coprosuis]HJD91347.1 carbohydrate kinase [Bacteroides coprosuis]